MFPKSTLLSVKCCLAFRCRRNCRRKLIGIVAALPICSVIMIITLVHKHAKLELPASTHPDDELNTTSIELMGLMNDADCAETFLQQYEKFCERKLVPPDYFDIRALSTNWTEDSELRQRFIRLCPCVPRHLLSKLRQDRSYDPFSSFLRKLFSPLLALSSHQFHSKLKTFLFEQSFPP